MTREEAIETIKTAIAEVEWEYPMNYAAAFEVAIKALEQEPCEDVVSRNAIIQTLNNMDRYVANELILCDTNNKFRQNEVFIVDDVFEQIAEQLPSVTPKPFINKPCVSEGVCREDKIQVLGKIRAEIDSYCSDNRDRNDGLYIAMRIIDKHLHEIESEVGK